MKIGDLVRKPSNDRDYGILGVVVDLTSRIDEGLVGIDWPDNSLTVVYENPLSLEVVG